MRKLILILITIACSVSYGQEKFKFRNISNYSLFTIKDAEWSVPDYDTEYRVPMYDSNYNQNVANFITKYENIAKEFDATEVLEKKERKVKRKALKNKKRVVLARFKPTFDALKSKSRGMIHYTGIDFVSPQLLEVSKKELQKLKGDIIDLKSISERELLRNVPKKTVKMKRLVAIENSSEIIGEYYIGGTIKVSKKNSVKDGTYKNQVIEKDINSNNYSTYTYYRSVDGSGINFYNNNIDIYDEYAVTRKPKPLTAKEEKIVAKMKNYKGQMTSLINKMAQFKSNTLVAREATKKGKILDKKIRALYGNNSDGLYDFMQLLDVKTIEVMNEFDEVLKGAAILFGL